MRIAIAPEVELKVSESTATIHDTAQPGIAKPLIYKCFDKPLSATAKERFDEICSAAKALDHPNIIALFEYGISDDGNAYLVTEKAEGTPLSMILAERGALNGVTATEVFSQILDALEYAISHKVHIGDLSPERIFVANLDTDVPVVKIAGIGVNINAFEQDESAKSLVADLSAAAYASPERCLGKPADERSVVYSIGCMLYEVIFGKRAFEGTDAIKLLFDHVNATSLFFPDFPRRGFARFREVVRKCMATDPNERFKDIASLRHRIENIEEPIRNEREATLLQQLAMQLTGARTPLGAEGFIVFSLLIALLCTNALIRAHIQDCDRLEKRVQKLMSPAPSFDSEEMVKSWKDVQLRGMVLGQPLSFFADCDMQIGNWEQMRSSGVEAFAHYKNAAGIYHRGRMYQEELGALDSAMLVYFSPGLEISTYGVQVDSRAMTDFDELLPIMQKRVVIAQKVDDQLLMSTSTAIEDLANLCGQKACEGLEGVASRTAYFEAYERVKTNQWNQLKDRKLQRVLQQSALQIQPVSSVQHQAPASHR
jgi:serine/threonine protein kinase